ncbi:hypothetical protein TTHERM_00193610 (macronuclear) [Tetrahymena thermophila SB210]|uniref:Uncharacterized protein n=1 Tax=Tetrahymena thermophila (strain SB210) TaxID=312017 RepID=Q23KH4_TETTS|nr:hypothetical protein TTHERM_00193610 [Tetrahymena thermophila SB210]EAR96869.2 hypothetical protein TTHERM_00193610 [Tetrahymena thermophila SB210]|eukprot:XP_001017114.2 hypothetical protein TTHERM_00193610 [Tetrahymena thermophila SB210]
MQNSYDINQKNVTTQLKDANQIKVLGQSNYQIQQLNKQLIKDSNLAQYGSIQSQIYNNPINNQNQKIIIQQQVLRNTNIVPQFIQNTQQFQNIMQKNINMLKKFEMETQVQDQTETIKHKNDNIVQMNENTIKKAKQGSLSSDYSYTDIKKDATKILENKAYSQGSPLKVQNLNQLSEDNKNEMSQNDTNINQAQSDNDQKQIDNQKLFNVLEIVEKNKEIFEKVQLLTQEIERLKNLIIEYEEDNKQLQEKNDLLQKNNKQLTENQQAIEQDIQKKQQSLEQSEQRRKELHSALENLQLQIKELNKQKENAATINLENEIKINQLLEENQRVQTINDSLFQEKLNFQEEIAKKTLSQNLQLQQIEDLTKEIRQRNEMIKQLESDKISMNQQSKQLEIMHLQSTIETEKLGIDLLEGRNQIEQLQQTNSELQLSIEQLNDKNFDLQNSKEVIINELNVTRETFLQIKSDLTNQISQLQEENRNKNLTIDSLKMENQAFNKQVKDQQLQIQQMNKKITEQEELLQKYQLQIATLNVQVQKEKDNYQLEMQKQQLFQSQVQELAEVNQQLQAKVKDFQSKYQEQILKIQQLELVIQQKNSQISSQLEQIKENQVLYNNLLKNNQEILMFNEELQKNDASKQTIDELNKEKLELIGKINLILSENERVVKVNEKLEKQLQYKTEEIDIKKKLLLQFQKENESFRSQINSLPQADRVETLLDTQKSQNQILMQRLSEKEKEIQIINMEFEQMRIKLLQYQQKEQLLNSEDASQMQLNHFKQKIQAFSSNNDKLQNENQQLYELLKLRKQEIQILNEKLDKRNKNTIQETTNTQQSNESKI